MASTAYISAATNRHPHAADISSSSLVAFGSSNLVALWDITNEHEFGVSETLATHEGLVTCIRFISDGVFVSGDDRGKLIVWRRLGFRWKATAETNAHKRTITSLCTLDNWVVTGSSDASLKLWRLVFSDGDTDELIEEQILVLSGRYPLALALTYLPLSKAICLASAGTDSKITLWVRSDKLASVLLGHEGWVKTLDFLVPTLPADPLVLASGSQDATIRLWNIESLEPTASMTTQKQPNSLSDELLDAFEASLGDMSEVEEGGRQITLKRHIISVKTAQGSPQRYTVTFDALLIGHEGPVTSLTWKVPSTGSSPTLLSTSVDSSVILWSPSTVIVPDGSSIWINRQRFGDIGGQRLGGFVGGGWARQGGEVLAWGWAGGWRRWVCESPSELAHGEVWRETGAISGHNGPVKGLDWSPNGGYLISAGSDQTTRIHGVMQFSTPGSPSWHELGRPQVHGYDLVDVAFIDPLRFVSIADEKVVRVFEAPANFVDVAERLGVANFTRSELLVQHHRPQAATVPPLGLSNRAMEHAESLSVINGTKKRRPFDGELASTTLWPEIEKVFGHGYESIALAVSPKKRFIATACKATTPEHAVVRVYSTSGYLPFGKPLEGHSLTVTRVAFSPDEKLILSVSRDRTWRLYEAHEGDGFIPVAADKSHGRIIWDCAWAAEGDVFSTASRDKTVRIWKQQQKYEWKAVQSIKTDAPATAVAFAAGSAQYRRRLAIGLETGEILIYSASGTQWRYDLTIPKRLAHVDQVHRLSWAPSASDTSTRLASCSEDGTLKITIVQQAME